MAEEIALLLTTALQPAGSDTGVHLLNACKQGDFKGFERLYNAHAGRMKSIAFHLLADRGEAEDALQETFLKIYRAVPAFEGDSGFLPWIYRILLNCCYDAARKRQRQAESGLKTEPSIPSQVPLQLALRHALARIHSGYRTVFWLFEAEGLRHSQIAAILEIPEGTSRKWLYEAKRELKRLLTEVRS